MAETPARFRFRRDGYLAPQRVLSPAAASRSYAAMSVDPHAPGPTPAYLSAWHHRHRWAFDLASDPRVLDAVQEVLGPDIVLWAMACWYKEPLTGRRVPWHQDAHHWPMTPTTTASAWLALSPCSRANGCLRVLPGTHTTSMPHERISDATSWFDRGLDGIDARDAVDLAMAPGEVALFDEGILHGSEANHSSLPRLGVSFRYSPPGVRFMTEAWPDAGRIRTFLVRGEDRERLNDHIQGAPPARSDADAELQGRP